MSALGHYLEEEGVATAVISLVREHTEVMRPPRALWVPFMLGRPLGAPDDPGFQREVLLAVLSLFEEPSGPVLRDFPRDAPASGASGEAQEDEGAACPVSFSRPQPAGEGVPALAAALQEEIAQLRPWHDLATRRRGGTGIGVSGLSVEQAGAFLTSMLETRSPANPRADLSLGQMLKFAADDLRTFYEEAATAQPGELSAAALQRWVHLQTIAGEVLLAAHRAGLASEDSSVRLVAEKLLIPRAIIEDLGPGAR
ncbi:MAG TPA: hypothetical protein VN324_12045 [Quisquiliibacterium sp.]|nr:hypothetical protein [Quisquiliibacterium sp.]